MSPLTFITLAAVLWGLFGRRGYGPALSLGGATASGSAVIAGGVGVPTFYAAALGTATWLVLRFFGRGRQLQGDSPAPVPVPGLSLFAAFFAWCVLITLIAPVLFDGQHLVVPGDVSLVAGRLTSSNIAQVVYAFLGISVLVYLARSPKTRPEVLGIAIGLTMILSFWRYLAQFGVPFPEGVFDNSPSFVYIEKAAGDFPRFRGIFSEPAALASSALVCIAYMIPRAQRVRGARRAGCLLLAGISLYLGVISTSATFVVAGFGILGIAAGTSSITFLAQATRLRRVIGIGCCAVVIVALWILPLVSDFVQETINSKVGSSSLAARSSANADAMIGFLRTGGLGYGLGSARASSLIPSLLAATGLVGSFLFVAGIGSVLIRAVPFQKCRPVVWALIALLTVKAAAGPDLSDATGVFWISLGVLAHSILGAEQSRRGSFDAPATTVPESLRLPPGLRP